MQLIRLGRTELMVSRIGFGGLPIQRLSEDQAVDVVRRCLDLGVNLIDTANSYTNSESRIGKAIQGRRQDVILATKTAAQDCQLAREHLNLSLQRLGVEYLDLYQFHNVANFGAYERILGPSGAMEAFEEGVSQGKIHHIGLTTHSPDVAMQAVRSGLFETLMFPFNLVEAEPADVLVPLARALDVGFIAMKPFAGGMLERADLAVKYLMQFPSVVPIPGVQKVAEVEEIIAIAEGPTLLSPAEMAEIESIRHECGTQFCRRCQYCMPCEQGVPITPIMIMPTSWKRLPPETFFEWFGEAGAKAQDCIECGECEQRCPYHLPIREKIRANRAFYEEKLQAYQEQQARGNSCH